MGRLNPALLNSTSSGPTAADEGIEGSGDLVDRLLTSAVRAIEAAGLRRDLTADALGGSDVPIQDADRGTLARQPEGERAAHAAARPSDDDALCRPRVPATDTPPTPAAAMTAAADRDVNHYLTGCPAPGTIRAEPWTRPLDALLRAYGPSTRSSRWTAPHWSSASPASRATTPPRPCSPKDGGSSDCPARHRYDIPGVEHVYADVLDPDSVEAAVTGRDVTHLFFTTWSRQDTEAENCRVNGAMLA